jgi:hypothetical protein
MVKRTAVVLGICAMILLVAVDASMALGLCGARGGGICGPCWGRADVGCSRPMYLPVDCPDAIQRTIVSTWECNIEGPCPPVSPPAMACGRSGLLGGGGDNYGLFLRAANFFGAPFDFLFGGRGGVYGCRGGGRAGGGPCGSPFGGFVPGALMSVGSTGFNFFGGLW